MKTAKAKYEFNTTQINPETNQYLGYVSEHVIMESGLTSAAIHMWLTLRLQYKKQRVTNKSNFLTCYKCDNKWLMAMVGIKKDKFYATLKELTEKGYLFSISEDGTTSYRVPLDPQDNDYKPTLNAIRKWLGEEPLQQELTEEPAPVVLVDNLAVDTEAGEVLEEVAPQPAPKAQVFDIEAFRSHCRKNYFVMPVDDKQRKILYFPTTTSHLEKELSAIQGSELIASAGYRVMTKAEYTTETDRRASNA